MNILFTTIARFSDDTTAGGEVQLVELVNELLAEKVSPFILFPDPGDRASLYVREYHSDGTYAESRFKEGASIEDNFASIVEKFGIDIVHFQHFQTLPLSLLKVTKNLKRRLVLTLHDYFLWCENFFLLSPLKGPAPTFCFFERDEKTCAQCLNSSEETWEVIYRRPWVGHYTEAHIRERRNYVRGALAEADLIIAPSLYVKTCFLGVFPEIDPQRFVVVEHGVGGADQDVGSARSRIPAQLKVAFLGGFKYEKGSFFFNDLLKTFTGEGVKFLVIGSVDTPIYAGKKATVKVTGRYNRYELGQILSAEGVDIILLLSPCAESYSYTLSEAIGNAIPVIATDIGAFRERVSKHGVGFLVPYENPVPRTAHLLNTLIGNAEILEFFRTNCIDAARSIKSLKIMAAEYIELYQKIGCIQR